MRQNELVQKLLEGEIQRKLLVELNRNKFTKPITRTQSRSYAKWKYLAMKKTH